MRWLSPAREVERYPSLTASDMMVIAVPEAMDPSLQAYSPFFFIRLTSQLADLIMLDGWLYHAASLTVHPLWPSQSLSSTSRLTRRYPSSGSIWHGTGTWDSKTIEFVPLAVSGGIGSCSEDRSCVRAGMVV